MSPGGLVTTYTSILFRSPRVVSISFVRGKASVGGHPGTWNFFMEGISPREMCPLLRYLIPRDLWVEWRVKRTTTSKKMIVGSRLQEELHAATSPTHEFPFAGRAFCCAT